MFVGDVGRRARRLLTLKISLRRLGGQPAVGASAQSVVLTTSHSSFIEVPSTGLQVCVCSAWLSDWESVEIERISDRASAIANLTLHTAEQMQVTNTYCTVLYSLALIVPCCTVYTVLHTDYNRVCIPV